MIFGTVIRKLHALEHTSVRLWASKARFLIADHVSVQEGIGGCGRCTGGAHAGSEMANGRHPALHGSEQIRIFGAKMTIKLGEIRQSSLRACVKSGSCSRNYIRRHMWLHFIRVFCAFHPVYHAPEGVSDPTQELSQSMLVLRYPVRNLISTFQ